MKKQNHGHTIARNTKEANDILKIKDNEHVMDTRTKNPRRDGNTSKHTNDAHGLMKHKYMNCKRIFGIYKPFKSWAQAEKKHQNHEQY